MKYIALSLATLIILSGCASTEPTEIESTVSISPIPTETESPNSTDTGASLGTDIETVMANMDSSCAKANLEGVVESEAGEGIIRLVLLPEEKAYESYSAFIETPEGNELIYETSAFFSCYLAGVDSLYTEQGEELPIKATAGENGTFLIEDSSFGDGTVSTSTYRFKDGLLVEVFEEDVYSIEISYGAFTSKDEATIKTLVDNLFSGDELNDDSTIEP
jgi:hypothetical protein